VTLLDDRFKVQVDVSLAGTKAAVQGDGWGMGVAMAITGEVPPFAC